jgi:type III secretory pathway component EscS
VNQGIHAALVLAMLWLLKRTALWKRQSESTAEWQFSIADLLTVLTVVAVLGAGMRRTEMFENLEWADIATYGCPAVLAMSAVLIWSLWRAPWVLRASGVVGVAIGLVAVVLVAERGLRFDTKFTVVVATVYLIHAVVLMVWLAWGPLLPRSHQGISENKP